MQLRILAQIDESEKNVPLEVHSSRPNKSAFFSRTGCNPILVCSWCPIWKIDFTVIIARAPIGCRAKCVEGKQGCQSEREDFHKTGNNECEMFIVESRMSSSTFVHAD